MRFSNTVEIDANPHAVFPWIANPDLGKRWMTSVSGGDLIVTTPEKVGSTFREVVEKDGKKVEMHGVITEYVPNERFSVRLEGERHMVDVCFRLVGNPRHTQMIQEVDLRLKGLLKLGSVFLRPMIKKGIQQQARAEFATLKRLVENESQVPKQKRE